MNLRENEPLARHTTLRTGGPSRFFVEATTPHEIKEAVQFAQRQQLPVLVLGGGSNVLAGDNGFDGVTIKVATRGIQTGEASADVTEVIAEAGEVWDALVACAVEGGLCGLENMSLIPGTVGGAVVGNVGAYGAEVKDTLRWAEALDVRTGLIRRFTSGECELGYRRSFFKSPAGRLFIVVRAAFALRRCVLPTLRYKELADWLAIRGLSAPTLAEVRAAVISIRQRKLPDPACVGTAGSFFKNPLVSPAEYEALAARHPGLPGHDEGHGQVKVALGWILDRICGLKGLRRGRVGTHSAQALVIMNEGGTAAEVEALAEEMARKIKETTGLDVEWEVERV